MAILINNFCIGLEEWISLSDLTSFSVNVTDLVYTVSTSGTYFMIDEVPIFTTFSGIVDGYIVSCSVPTISGGITTTVHAENDNSDIVEEDYDLLFGYHVSFNELIDWGPDKEVIVWSTAKNDVLCPNTETVATFFRTKPLENRSLGATITSIEYNSNVLGASIVPQSKYFLPGYTYIITVSGIKDYSGNEMNVVQFNFTIEDN